MFSKMAAAVLPPSCYLARSPFLSLSFTHTYSFSLSHTFSLSISLIHTTHAFARRRACKVSRMRATRTRARPPLSQKHPLRFTLCTKALLPPSPPRPSPPPPPPAAPPAAYCSCRCVIVSSPIVSQKNRERKQRTRCGRWTPFLLPSLTKILFQDSYPIILFEVTSSSVPNSLMVSEDEDELCSSLASAVEK